MATLNLLKPSIGAQTVLTVSDQLTDYTFDFDLFDAIIEKIDDNLVISFDADGSSIVLEDFYAVYNAEFMPNFVLDGELVSGEDFFNAMDPNLMPAAGPAAAEVAQDTNGVYSTGGRELDGGVDALGGKDGGSAYDVDPTLLEGGASQGGDGGNDGENTSPPDIEPTLSFDNDSGLESANHTTYDDEDKGRTDTGSFTFTPGNGPADVTINGESIFDENGDIITKPFVGDEGSLTITGYDPATGEVTYTYEQDGARDHSDGDVTDGFKVVVTDKDGDSVEGNINIKIEDDGPKASEDSGTVAEGATLTVDAENGLLNNDSAGADGYADKAVTKVTSADTDWKFSTDTATGIITGTHDTYGTLTVNPDGSYTFDSKANSITDATPDFEFNYTISDSDGDTTTSTLTIDPTEAAAPTPPKDGYQVIVDESDLATGTNPTGNTEEDTWTPDKGYTLESFDENSFDHALYDVRIDEDGNLKVVLKENVKHADTTDNDESKLHADANVDTTITVTVKDTNGNLFDVDVNVTIKDDGPIITGSNLFDHDDNANTDAASLAIVENGTASAEIDIEFGADMEGAKLEIPADDGSTDKIGVKWENETWVKIDPNDDHIIIEGNIEEGFTIILGDVTFTTTNNYDWTVSYEVTDARTDVNITATDGDGDSVKHTIAVGDVPEIGVGGDDNPPASVVTTYDAAVENADTSGEQPESATATVKGNFTITSEDGVYSFSIGGEEFTVDPDGYLNPDGEATKIEGEYGYITNVEILNNNDGTYTVNYDYTQDKVLTDDKKHDDNTSGDGNNSDYNDDVAHGESFDIVVTDNNGDVTTAPGGIQVNIVDDVIAFTDDGTGKFTAETVSEEGSEVIAETDGTVTANSADGVASIVIAGISIEGKELGTDYEVDLATGKVSIDGKEAFTVTVDKDGNWSMKQTEELEGDVSITFKATDGDGDTTTTNVTVEAYNNDQPALTFDVPEENNNTHTTYDAAVAGKDASGKQPLSGAATADGSFIADGGDQLTSLTISGKNAAGETVDFDLTKYTKEELADLVIYGEYGNLSGITYNATSGEVEYTYTQTEVYDHDASQGESTDNDISDPTWLQENKYKEDIANGADEFKVTVWDKDGESAEGSIKVNIVDDVIVIGNLKDVNDEFADPIIKKDAYNQDYEAYVVPEATEGPDGDVSSTVNGKLDIDGADDLASLELAIPEKHGTSKYAVTVTIDGQEKVLVLEIVDDTVYAVEGTELAEGSATKYDISDPYFTFTLNNDGSWTYTQLKGFTGDVSVAVTGTDSDGDSDTHFVTFQGNEDSFQADLVVNDALNVDESGLPDGTEDTTDLAKDSGTIFIETNDKASEITVNIAGSTITFDASGNQLTGPTSIEHNLENGTLSGFKLVATKDGYNLKYTYTQDTAIEHNPNKGPDDTALGDSFNVSVTTTTGTVSTTVDVTIEDDAPVEQPDYDAALGADNMASAIVEIDFGADNGGGKMLEFGDSKFTFNGTTNKWECTEGTGSVSEDGKTLTSGDGTILSNSGSSDLWNVKYDASTDLSETITYTDSDGDKADVTLNAEPFDGDVVANDGLATHLAPGTDYNIAIVLDTSGSMYDDTHHGVISSQINGASYVTRLDAACDALRDLANTLYEHAQSDLGGQINVHLGQFWGGSSSVNFTLGHDFKDGETLEDQVLELLAAIDAIDHGLQYNPEIVQVWDDSMHTESSTVTKIEVEVVTGYNLVDGKFEPITETQYYVGDKYGDIVYKYPSSTEEGYYDNPFHWGTNFGEGFEDAAEWYNSEGVSGNGFQNEVFFMTDGKTSGNTQIAYDKLIDAIGSEGNVNAYGMGSGADEEELKQWDNTEGPTMTEDGEIGNMLDPNKGEATTTPIKSSIAFTTDGNDVLIGGISIEKLKAALEAEFPGQEFTDAELALFMKNNPTWIFDNVDFDSKIQDPDGLVAGAGDDDLYGQGGNDILIGDGDENTWAKIADGLVDAEKMTEEEAAKYEYDYLTTDQDGNPEKDHTQELLQGMHEKLSSLDADTLKNIVDGLEKANSKDDGDDNLYGGDGHDILLGLGGDDIIYGGEGNDIIFGGSGNDFIYGGEGNDTIFAGSGSDTIYGGAGSDTIYLDSEGEEGLQEVVGYDRTFDDIVSFEASDFTADAKDVIHNFDSGNDLLDLTALTEANYNISTNNQDGNGVVTITDDSGKVQQTITLVGAEFSDDELGENLQNLGENSFIKL